MGVIGTNSGAAGANILGLTTALASGSATAIGTGVASLSGGLNLALAPRINGQYYLGRWPISCKTVVTPTCFHPNLMTLDNGEARIVIGNNVPFVTGSWRQQHGQQHRQPFTTVERKDVGLMLRVRPQINENGTVKMAIYQEVSKIDGNTLGTPTAPPPASAPSSPTCWSRRQHHRAGRPAGRQLFAG